MNRLEALQPLRHRPYRLILTARTVSGLGDWLDLLGVVVLVTFWWELGPGALAAVTVTTAVPWVALAPLAGVWADRLPGKPVLVACDLARGAVVLCYLLAPNLPALLVLVLLKGCVAVLFAPAQQRAVKLTVPADDLLGAVSLNAFVTQSTKIGGPLLGGAMVAAVGPYATFVADAATFLVSALLLSRVRLPRPSAEDGAAAQPGRDRRFRAELGEGFRFIATSRTLLFAVGGMTATVLIVFTFDTLSPLALKELGFGPSEVGLAIGSVGFGAVSGAAVVSQWGKHMAPLLLMGVSQLAAGVLVNGFGGVVTARLDAPPLVWLPLLAGVGAASAGVLVAYPYILQRETSVELLGRVTATAGTIPTAVQLAAPPIGAAIATRYGVGSVFTAGGTGLMVLGVIVMLARPDRVRKPRPVAGETDGPPEPAQAVRTVPEPEVVAHAAPPPGGRGLDARLRSGSGLPGIDHDARSFLW
jgi:MFS family permease